MRKRGGAVILEHDGRTGGVTDDEDVAEGGAHGTPLGSPGTSTRHH